MSTAEISYSQLKTLNLLLKQQVITQIDNSKEATQDEIFNFHKTIKIHEEETLNEFQAEIYKDDFLDKCDDIKIQLCNIQLEESSSIEHHKTLCESYDLLENLFEHILQHVECLILEIKTSNKLTLMLNHLTNLNSHQNTSEVRNTSEQPSDIEHLQAIRNILCVSLNKYDKISGIREDYTRKERDYHLALKNFKIILEVMEVNEKCLEKLKQQFCLVVDGYHRCRSILEQEMPFIMGERTKILGECLLRLGESNKKTITHRMDLIEVMNTIGKKLSGNHGMGSKEAILSEV